MKTNCINLKSRNLANEKQIASALGLSVKTLQNWRWAGGGPKDFRISGRSVRYLWAEVEAWLEGKVVANTSEVLS